MGPYRALNGVTIADISLTSRAFVRDTSADKLSDRASPCVFLGFPPDAPGWQFYHPTSRRVLPSQDVTFDEPVPFYRLFPYRSAPLPAPPLFLAPGPPPVDPPPLRVLLPQPGGAGPAGAEPGGAESEGAGSGGAEPWGAEPGGTEPAGAETGGAESEGAELGGAEPWGAEPGGTEPAGAETGGVESAGAEPGGAEPERGERGGAEPERTEPGGTLSTRGPPGALSRREPLSPPQLREWFARRTRLWSGAAGGGGAAGVGAGGTGAGAAGGTVAAGVGAGGTRAGAVGGTGATGLGGARTGGTGAAGARGAIGVGAGGTGDGAARGTGAAGPGGARPRGTGAAGAGGATGVGVGDPRAGDTGAGGAGPGGAGSVGAGSGDTGRPRPYFVPMLQQPASPLPAPSPYTEQTGGFTGRREPVSRPVSPVRAVRTGRRVPRPRPPPVRGTHYMALRPSSVPLCVPLPSPPVSSLPAILDPESDLARTASPGCTRHPDPALLHRGNYGVKRPTSSPPAFKARYVARGFCQRQGVDFFQTFSPTPKMTTLRVLLHVAAQRDYELHSLDFSTAFLQCSLHEEIWLRRPPGFNGSFPAGAQWSLRRPVYDLRQAPHKWHDTLRTTLAALGFAPSTADPSKFLRTDTSLSPFYVLVYVDDLVFATADAEALAPMKSELQM
ncbi:unnamed protein product [Closterium sp. NIES-53]